MKRPAIKKPRLKWVRNRRGIYEPYHRTTWVEGGKRRERAIKLDWQGDPERLDVLYWQCEAGRHDRQQEPAKYTWRECIEAWRSDPRVQGRLTTSTKKSYRRDMDRIMELNGPKDMRRTTRKAIRQAHSDLAEQTRKADKMLTIVSLLWNYAREKLDWPLGDNPAQGIERYGRQREYEPWPEWMIDHLPDAPETVRTAAEIILGTGQRPSAAIAMRHADFVGEWVTVRDEKRARSFDIYCPARLRDYIASLPKKGEYILARDLRTPVGYDAVERAFRTWRKGLGEAAAQFTLHGLRKLAIVRLAEAGCSDAEIQAVTGQSAAMVAYYRSNASRRRLSRAAQERRE